MAMKVKFGVKKFFLVFGQASTWNGQKSGRDGAMRAVGTPH